MKERKKERRTVTYFGPLYIKQLFTLHLAYNSTRSYNRNIEILLLLCKVGPILSIPLSTILEGHIQLESNRQPQQSEANSLPSSLHSHFGLSNLRSHWSNSFFLKKKMK